MGALVAVTFGIFFVVKKQWCRSWDCKACKRIPKNFGLWQIYAKSQNILEKKLQNFTTSLIKLYFLVFECINISVLHHKKHIKYIQNQQTVSSIFVSW